MPRIRRKPHGEYLEHRTMVRVRFQEVDSLRIVWHGHYLTYFEEARVALGKRYGIGYTDFVEAGLLAPVIHATCDYLRPASFMDELEVAGRIYRRDSSKLHYYFEIRRPKDNMLLTTGQTIHALTDLNGTLCLTLPEFIRGFYAKWAPEMRND